MSDNSDDDFSSEGAALPAGARSHLALRSTGWGREIIGLPVGGEDEDDDDPRVGPPDLPSAGLFRLLERAELGGT